MSANLFDELQWRGLVYDATEGLADAFAKERVTAYIGFDPTASSLHVGTLLTIMGLARLQRFGHSPIAIVGGGTGMIGDPSGKSQERQLLSREQIDENVAGIKAQLERFLDFDAPVNPARIVNNADWLASFDLLGFLRDTGKYFTVNYMLQKESVKTRLDVGMSYTEFSYMLLQAYDYLQLHRKEGVTLQIGGSDQWGNITAGIELIRRSLSAEAHALTFPLLTTASGKKFGKSEAGAVWLDPERTSPYQFYQFWINTDDRDVGQSLRTFTLLERDEIESLDRAVHERPESRDAQRTLAREVTRRVHGEQALQAAEEVSALLFGKGDPTTLSPNALDLLEREIPVFRIDVADPRDSSVIIDAVSSGKDALFKSKGEARRAVSQGGLYLNGERLPSEPVPISHSQFLPGRRLLVRKGARTYGLVVFGRA